MSLRQSFGVPAHVFSLIDEVRKRPVLWDNDNRRDTYTYASAMSAWKEISDVLGIHEEKCKTKWKHMRDSFRRLKRLQQQKPTQSVSKWRYYKRMRFLEPQLKLGRRRMDTEDLVYTSAEEDDHDEGIIVKLEPTELRQAVQEEVMVEAEPQAETSTLKEYDALEMREVTSDDDYNLMFLKSLLPFFRRLDPLRCLVVRNKLQEVLFSEIKEQESLD